MPLPHDRLAPATIFAMPPAQQIMLHTVLTLDGLLPASRHSLLVGSAAQLGALSGLAFDEASDAANALYAADWLHCFAVTNADNANHSYTGYQPSDFARANRAWLLRQLDAALPPEAGQ